MEEEPAKTKPSAGHNPETAGSLLRTGVGARPQAASRVLDKPYQQKFNADDSSFGDYDSKATKDQPWDYYGIGSSKSVHQNHLEEPEPAQEDAEVKPTASQGNLPDSGQDFEV